MTSKNNNIKKYDEFKIGVGTVDYVYSIDKAEEYIFRLIDGAKKREEEGIGLSTMSLCYWPKGGTIEEIFVADNLANSLEISSKINLSKDAIMKIEDAFASLKKPIGIPSRIKSMSKFLFAKANEMKSRLQVSGDPSSEVYACRKEGFNLYGPVRVHFDKVYDDKYSDNPEVIDYTPYLVYPNGVHIFSEDQTHAMDSLWYIIDWGGELFTWN